MRVPFADVGPVEIPEWMRDEDAGLLTDVAARGYFGAQLGEITEGDTVVVLGAGPVGLIARHEPALRSLQWTRRRAC